MSTVSENAFQALANAKKSSDKSKQSAASTELKTEGDKSASSESSTVASSGASGGDGEDSSWTVQSSAKPRRLVPQYSISRQDLGAENDKNKAAAEVAKKKGTYYILFF